MGGIRQYSVALLNILAKDKENNYFVYHETDDPEVVRVLNNNPQLKQLKTTRPQKKKGNYFWTNKIRRAIDIYRQIIARSRIDNKSLDNICRENQIQIIHCPYQFLPESSLA